MFSHYFVIKYKYLSTFTNFTICNNKRCSSKEFEIKLGIPVSTVRELLPSFSYKICLVHLYVETPQLRRDSSLVEPVRKRVLEPAPPFWDTSGGAVK